MLSLELLILLTVLAALIAFWWRSDEVKRLTLASVQQQTRELNLQLLDQTLVLRGLWPIRDPDGRLQLRRRYSFEFTTQGEARYAGQAEVFGNRIQRIDLAPHMMPEE